MASQSHKEMLIQEKEKFLEKLPELILNHKNEWVVFKDSSVVEYFDDLSTAYEFAISKFGVGGYFLIEKVEDQTPKPMSFSFEIGAIQI